MPKDMTHGRVDCSTIARIDRDTADRLSHHLLEEGDIVLSPGRRRTERLDRP